MLLVMSVAIVRCVFVCLTKGIPDLIVVAVFVGQVPPRSVEVVFGVDLHSEFFSKPHSVSGLRGNLGANPGGMSRIISLLMCSCVS